MPLPPMSGSLSRRGLLGLATGLCLACLANQPARAIEVTGSNFDSGVYELLQFVGYSVTFRGTVPFNLANGANQTEGPYAFILYVRGDDIYGNDTFIEVRRGVLTGLRGPLFRETTNPDTGAVTTTIIEPALSQTIQGIWQVPNDGTLHRAPGEGGYGFVMAVYPTANFPTTLPELFATAVSAGSTSAIHVSVTPDIRINQPGATYRAGLYRGGDIIRFSTEWRNNRTMDNVRESRPLRPISQDRYVVNLRLSTDPEYREDGGTNDDFNLMYGANGLAVTGDLGGLPPADATTEWRKITVTSTPGRIPPYGIAVEGAVPPAFITGTQRDYTPQPDDGWLDIGESVKLSTEHLVPRSYTGRYFVASNVRMSNADFDARPGNNTFVSNAANKVEILQDTDSTVETVSAIMDQNANYVQGGDAASDYGSVSDGGNFIAFASRAQNLLVPPNLATGAAIPAQYLTTGQQIFLRNRQMRETVLASRSAGNVQANADCFDPVVSANGAFVAFESAATNLVEGANTGGKSMIYVYDVRRARPVIISRNRAGQLANGDSMRPSISESGRFVAFESIATNLDLPQFTAVRSSGGTVSRIDAVRRGAGYNPAVPPQVTLSAPQIAGGVQATAVAVVENNPNGYGTIRSINVTNAGSGYSAAPTVTVAPPPAGFKQVYLHDRNVDGRTNPEGEPIFDAAGNTATYLVSVNERGVRAGQVCNMPVVNLDDEAPVIAANNGGMYVAFVSYARDFLTGMPLGTGYAMVYRTLVKVEGAASSLGAVPSSVTAVSVNDFNQAPTANDVDSSGAPIVPYSWEPAINGDGSQVAFTSAGTNLVYDEESGQFDGDTNLVPDVFVRNLAPGVFPTTSRVSVSQDRVATGTIVFSSPPAPGNIPVNQPALGDFIEISDGFDTRRFTFAVAGGGDNVPIGPSVQVTRNSLVAAINGSGLNIIAEATTPPDAAPGTGFSAGIYLKNTLPGTHGNVPITLSSAVLLVSGMDGGGTQAEDAPVAVQGVPFGSGQPNMDRTGRFVAYRTIAQNMDVHVATDSNSFPDSPITGELIRPLIFPTSNIYLHDRRADGDDSQPFDLPGNYTSTRMSVSKFGYPAIIFGAEPGGVGSTTSANSSAPALSPDARFVVFSSDAEGFGGLVYGPNNLSPLDVNNVRDVYIHDRITVGDNPPVPSTKPVVELLSPADGLRVAPNTAITISAAARPAPGKTISSVAFFVNNVLIGTSQTEPFSATYTVPTTGEYLVRAVATDSAGLSSEVFATIFAERPPAGAPFVQMTQPIAGLNFVTGSKLFLNAVATASPPATIKDESVSFTVNGIPSSDRVGKLGNKYGVLYTPTEPFIVDTYRASATDSNNVSNQSAPLFSFLTLALSPLPEVRIQPLSPAIQINAGQSVQLVAEAFFPQTGTNARIPARVEFYVNKVYVGDGIAGQVLPNGRTLYTLNWEVSQDFVDASNTSGVEIFEVYARAVALNWQTNTENNNVIEIYGSVVDGPTPMTVYYVPSNPAAGSNAAFVNDTFQKLFLREPTYDEYSYYLDLMNSGFSQAETVVVMAESDEFAANQQVLFGYYARMGLQPTSKTNVSDPTSVSNLLNLMTNGTNATLLPAGMSVGPIDVPALGPSPYGATIGQSLVATRLIQSITNRWTNNVLPRNLSNLDFMNWMRRTFNQPYLPEAMPTNRPVVKIGDDNQLLTTIQSFPATGSPATTRYGYSYAFLSGLYAEMPLANIPNSTNNNLRATISNFPGLVRGAAVSYLLSPTGQWPTNAFGAIDTNAVLSTNLVMSNLPPQITSPNEVSATVGVIYTNLYQITAANVGPSPGFTATNLPPGITNVNSTNGIISGTPTAEGVFKALVSATNAVGQGTKEVAFTVVAPPPTVTSTNLVTAVLSNDFSYQIEYDPAGFATTYSLSPTNGLPAGLSFDKARGEIFGIPTQLQTNVVTISVANSGGTDSKLLTIQVQEAPEPDGDGEGEVGGLVIAGSTELARIAFGDAALVPLQVSREAGEVELLWLELKDKSNVTYSVWSSQDLVRWEKVDISAYADGAEPPDQNGVPDGYERRRVAFPIGEDKGFYRVEACFESCPINDAP